MPISDTHQSSKPVYSRKTPIFDVLPYSKTFQLNFNQNISQTIFWATSLLTSMQMSKIIRLTLFYRCFALGAVYYTKRIRLETLPNCFVKNLRIENWKTGKFFGN
jgi:hypothetical protein